MHKIKTSQPEVLWNSKCILGEGVTWVKEHNSLYYVDIKRKKIFKLNYKNKNKKIYKIEKEIGFLAQTALWRPRRSQKEFPKCLKIVPREAETSKNENLAQSAKFAGA